VSCLIVLDVILTEQDRERMEYHLTSETGVKSIFIKKEPIRYLNYPRHPFPSNTCSVISSIPIGFHELALKRRLSLELLDVLKRMGKWKRAMDRIQQDRSAASPSDLAYVLEYESLEDVKDLRYISEALKKTSLENKISDLEDWLCKGLILYTLNVWRRTRWTRMYQRLRMELTEALQVFNYADKLEKGCLIWLTMVTVESWKIGFTLLLQGSDLIRHLLDANKVLENWQNVENILQRFFCYGPLTKEWKVCWGKAMRLAGVP
jgi:hypothetical protein